MNEERIAQIEERLAQLPQGTLTYKTINGKEQPYLQSYSKGHSKSYYIKQGERELIFEQLEERTALQQELGRLKRYQERMAAILKDNPYLTKKPGVGYQDFEMLMQSDRLYIDKTHFIEEWWNSDAQVTLITRPRRFGKTLMQSTVNCFFSNRYANRSDLFSQLKIWKNKEMRALQGQVPVIFVTFAGVKGSSYQEAIGFMSFVLAQLLRGHDNLLDSNELSTSKKKLYTNCLKGLESREEYYCCMALPILSELLYCTYHREVMILWDEYDTPIQEAYLQGYWEKMMSFMRKCFHFALKSNPYLGRVLLTGITRVAKESMFSDLNHLSVHTVTSGKYSDCFGFTEQEVFDCMECQDVQERQEIKAWYDGFTIGERKDIYNPWSIVNYLSERRFLPYWSHSGGYGLMDRLFRQGKNNLKEELGILLKGGSIHKTLDEDVNFQELDNTSENIWSLLLAAGYVKADNVKIYGRTECDLSITNRETMLLFDQMIAGWFRTSSYEQNAFIKALLCGDIDSMTQYMNVIALECFSVFDVGKNPSEKLPERFYHGFVLGLLVELREEYEIRSNRESGYGRYDVMMVPLKEELDAVILEFKVRDDKKEKNLAQTAGNALKQIEEKNYIAELLAQGIAREKIRTYGFAFEGKEVLIQEKNCER